MLMKAKDQVNVLLPKVMGMICINLAGPVLRIAMCARISRSDPGLQRLIGILYGMACGAKRIWSLCAIQQRPAFPACANSQILPRVHAIPGTKSQRIGRECAFHDFRTTRVLQSLPLGMNYIQPDAQSADK
jgi:hypothetical protein